MERKKVWVYTPRLAEMCDLKKDDFFVVQGDNADMMRLAIEDPIIEPERGVGAYAIMQARVCMETDEKHCELHAHKGKEH